MKIDHLEDVYDGVVTYELRFKKYSACMVYTFVWDRDNNMHEWEIVDNEHNGNKRRKKRRNKNRRHE